MPSNPMTAYGWYPNGDRGEQQAQRELRVTREWVRQNLPEQAQTLWQNALRRHHTTTVTETMNRICKFDSAEMVELLYPRYPQLFHTARKYTLSPELFPCVWDQPLPYSEEVLTQCCHSRRAHLDAACLFALTGAAACLEAMLDHGADPDGLETPESWSYIELPHHQILPVTPMDCALLADNEHCQMVLELYGGKSLHEHLANP